MDVLEKIVPQSGKYKHDRLGEGNAHAHVKSTLIGKRVVVGISDGKLELGTWEAIFFAEFDGPRNREIGVKIVG